MKADEKKVGEGVKFERIRRITGYLVGSTYIFYIYKRAEDDDSVIHSTAGLMKAAI